MRTYYFIVELNAKKCKQKLLTLQSYIVIRILALLSLLLTQLWVYRNSSNNKRNEKLKKILSLIELSKEINFVCTFELAMVLMKGLPIICLAHTGNFQS